LDPADPYFENTERMIRLDSSDALFVDVIHTDAAPFITGGLGLMQLSGHVDFYPNGGVQQPGCGESVLDSIEKEQGSVIYGQLTELNSIEVYSFNFS
jgi:pancreatic triacylglycerol lipase